MSPDAEVEDLQSLQTLPLLPVKNTVLFPSLLMPFPVGRVMSMAAVEAALATEEKEIIVVTQRDASIEEPTQSDLYAIGTKAVIKKMAQREDYVDIIVHGVERVVIVRVGKKDDKYLEARVRPSPLPPDRSTEIEALRREVLDLASRAHELSRPRTQIDFSEFLSGPGEDPIRLVYTLGSVMTLELEKEQALLEANTVQDALRLMYAHLRHEVQVLEIRNKIAADAQSELTKQQREYVLRQQLRAIQNELGEADPEKAASDDVRQRLEKADLPEEVRREAEKELMRLERVPTASPEHGVIRTYLELILELPWNKASETVIDIGKTRTVLDEDHYDLKEVKERILEHLGVLKLNPGAKAPILCFVGPPGVGKTSLGQSIARSMGRKFERMSLGGMSDEAELRGHRRTYIGAMPGRVLQALRRAGVNNPVVMLDEVDKLGRDFRGDPAAALLEVLDPEQNKTFRDNYLDMPFDISKTLFVTTANTLGTIPQPLLDRMEVLRLPGYSEEEKLEIAKRYLVPRQVKETGLTPSDLTLPDETLRHVIERYTRESGVRRLERAIGRLARKVALRFAEGHTEPVTLRPADVGDMLGPETFFPEKARQDPPAGVAAGLAVTEAGGDVLYIETTLLPEGRGMTLTGQLGEVMQESARAAQSWILSHAEALGIDGKHITQNGVHVHVPAGAIPKDGPSAGVTMVSAMASLYTGRPVRHDTAMTGEITLTGLVLPVGGIKEKVLAARRAGLKRIVLPGANRNDLRELPDNVRAEMEFIFADRIDDVLEAVLPKSSAGRSRSVARAARRTNGGDHRSPVARTTAPARRPRRAAPARRTAGVRRAPR
jgi:ATP-dependent Lon protease